ncbi:MAG: YdeI/OmpD-associated family protein [Nitrospirota bacterium]
MEITRTLYVADRKKWRAWLRKHYRTEKDIWLVFYRKETGKPRIAYNDAVEEALCFGWIDSTVKKLDDERFAQRFSPRNPATKYSQTNKERLRRLIADSKVMKDVLARMGDLAEEAFVIPPDILKALKTNKEAWKNFRKFPPEYQRIRISYIDHARSRPGEFKKRLRNFISKTEMNKQFGFGIRKFY